MTEQELIEGCKKENRTAQKALYDQYASLMFSICLRYVKNRADAEDVMIEGFYKIMSKINQYSGQGSFEGWMRRVMVNEALMFLRKNSNFKMMVEVDQADRPTVAKIEHELAAQDILKLLDKLPTGYRTVFNLYVIEGLKHREIADELGISINTSKSQLILAKKRLREMIRYQESSGVRSIE
ncbi:MAG: sigma-70 family RNA polymerase sigma factor [Bacteroidetes bacterium]|nr:sigma-70 family RNA polymerase sigma factor [Bacteroidota bacterium]